LPAITPLANVRGSIGTSDAGVIVCPSCRRRAFTRRDVLFTVLDGTARCRLCGQTARLDLLSRWVISCVVAIVLSMLLLYGGVFYSGHLFLVSLFLIFGGWAALCWIGFPFLTLETVPRGTTIDPRIGLMILLVLLFAAMMFDAFMRSGFD
jgi:hypothetical protein